MKIPMPITRDNRDLPRLNEPLLAVVQHWKTYGKKFAILKRVNDCDYRTVDDDSELSHDWVVVAWEYLPELF